MPAPYPNTDSLVGPIIAQLALVAGQVQGVGRLYEEAPDAAPEDNSVLFPLREWRVKGDTNAKLKVELDIEVLHLFRRGQLPSTLARAQTFLFPWFQALAAWPNQDLGGTAICINLSHGKLYETKWADIPYLALSHTVTVLTEFNIPTS